MALVRYLPEEGTPAEARQFGITFGPEPVEVTDPRVLAKIAGSPFYEIVGAEPAPPQGYRAVHNGGPRFVVVFGDKDETVLKGLNKADAEAFNALSDGDKTAYIEAYKE